MRGNLVAAAAVFGAGMVLASLVFVVGVRWALNGAVDRLDAAVAAHGQAVERAGERVGPPVGAALKDVAGAFDQHGRAVERAGDRIAHPQLPTDYSVKLQGPVAVQQPLLIRGPADDGALPVNARVAK